MKGFTPPRKLTSLDSVDGFQCGAQVVDDWVHSRALNAEERGTAVVYAAFYGDQIAGIYSLSSHAVAREDVSGGWLKRNAPAVIPVILLGMFGIDLRFQGQGLGASLLSDAIARAVFVADQIGAKALLVDPIDDGARTFYEKYGFTTIPGMERMFVSLRKS